MALHCASHRTVLRPAVLTALAGAIALFAPGRDARADTVAPSPKGIVGGALLGADIVTIGESLVGVRAGWAYAVGALVGAGGGGAAGFAIEQGSTDGKVPMYMLAGGLALVIPAIVLTLDATRYMPEEGAVEDRVPTGPVAEPGTPASSVVGPAAAPGATPAPSAPAAAPAPPPATPPPQSLLDIHRGALRMGVPVPDVLPVFSLAQQRQYGMQAQTELRLPLLHVTF
jgi:hypothetical protein